jgi:phenylalanyl-tRNA synthetase beta subunit
LDGAEPQSHRPEADFSCLVDITNFVMIDLGRPLHVYDKAKLSGGLVARKAKAGEQVLALNGKTYTLDEGMTVIADSAHVHDIGGIMGGIRASVRQPPMSSSNAPTSRRRALRAPGRSSA